MPHCPQILSLVISGTIKTFKQSDDGRELITGMYSADDYLGINASLSGANYIDTAVAVEASSPRLMPALLLDQLLNAYPEVGREFIRLLSADPREKEEQLLQLACHSVPSFIRFYSRRVDRQERQRHYGS